MPLDFYTCPNTPNVKKQDTAKTNRSQSPKSKRGAQITLMRKDNLFDTKLLNGKFQLSLPPSPEERRRKRRAKPTNF